MRFDRKRFFDEYRERFGPLDQAEVNGLNQLLAFAENDPTVTDIRHLAYMLATVLTECGDDFAPVREIGPRAYFNRYDIQFKPRKAKELGNLSPGDGYKYRGGGYPQTTGRSNFGKVEKAWNDARPSNPINLIDNPDQILIPEVAWFAMSWAMRVGAYTGRKLSDYINGDETDYYHARRIINALDRANYTAENARHFEAILRAALEV